MSSSPRVAKTRDRLIEAAIKVLATAGIAGSTTREIASTAGVSEVTLFRHFQNKEQLLSEVSKHVTARQAAALVNPAAWTQDLHHDLLHYACLYNNMLEEHEALVRMFIGEAHRHPQDALRVLQDSAIDLREKLIAYLQAGVDRGTIRPDQNLSLVVDLFTGMLLSGMLRRCTVPIARGYSRAQYIEGCVELLIRSIGPTDPAQKSQK